MNNAQIIAAYETILSITGQMQARGQVTPPGVWTPDECMPASAYIAELRKRGMDLVESNG